MSFFLVIFLVLLIHTLQQSVTRRWSARLGIPTLERGNESKILAMGVAGFPTESNLTGINARYCPL